jgi:phospholipid/cholesterol/gamma-HCH transport system substrate-binding protein
MSNLKPSRLEGKVGLFVFVGLVLLAVLLIQFSKGTTFFRSTYDIRLQSPTVSGLKTRAQVLMAGVQIGTVAGMQLAPDGQSVTITLRIYRPYKVQKDARFLIRQAGFLGDQYIAIVPSANDKELLSPGGEAKAETPLDMQEVAHTAAGLLVHIDAAATNLNEALRDARRTVLSGPSLTNLSLTMSNLNLLSDRSLRITDNLVSMVETNREAIALSVSNLVAVSEQLKQSAASLGSLLATNSPQIEATVSNMASFSATLKNLVDGVQAGKGLAGNLLENEQIASNVSQIVHNLSITTSNLNRLGLWGVLRQHKGLRTNEPPVLRGLLFAPKNPFE